jgi:hypothetical protein
MASLEDTFRMMNGEEPINPNRMTAEDKNFNESRTQYRDVNGHVSGKITKDFMQTVTRTLIENQGGVYESQYQKPLHEKQTTLVENAKVLTAILNSIKPDRLDERVLLNVAKDIQSLTDHLLVYPEFENIIERRIK